MGSADTTNNSSSARIAVIGTGTWGCAAATVLARTSPQKKILLWGRNTEKCTQMQQQRLHPLMDTLTLPGNIIISDNAELLSACTLVFWAVPTQHTRAIAQQLRTALDPNTAIVSLSKGLEQDTLLSITHILQSVLDTDTSHGSHNYGVLSGPSHAEEVTKGLPAGLVMAGNEDICTHVVDAMHQNNFRIYTCQDVVGVEMGGALKNVVAIAAGICDGMKLGDNIKATLVTRGLAEMRRLGRALGAEDSSFAGLAGIGDLLTTCYSPFGRNRSLGERIGAGESASDILASSTMVAEGAWTSQAALSLGRQLSVDLPVAEQVTAVLWQGKPLQDAMNELLSRESKDETL